MTRLAHWLLGLIVASLIWLTWLSTLASISVHALLVPAYFVIAFGIYCIVILSYRVATFNECPEAATQMRQDIEEARADLLRRGYVF
ncbi:unnamed protein product [Cyprideis torosa]|uniref:Dolichol-phosphate mannosyltransferase subunit 3 n=1 Tax=Cyprideis torosa TaxID=163714 RepID=A0A7R8WPD8_9CRUS|nr:unnamed protein product [Cyprideis torosa]CAG0900621.1 unnamed protein product [Cyprideis torosa]